MKMFGTNGIRGESNGYLNCELALKVGKSIVTVLGPGPIAIAMDTRISSDMIRSAVSAGMMSMGADVHNLGMIPTPALQYYVKTHKEVTGGVMITASHNPPEFNGIKCVSADGTECKPEEEAAIEDAYDRDLQVVTWKEVGHEIRIEDAGERYIDAVVSKVDVDLIKKAKLKVCLDCANGASVRTSPLLLEKLGVEAVIINGEPDGMFPGHYSEPVEENLWELKERVVKESADLGFAHDGDADRCIFVSDKGTYLPGDYSLAILSKLQIEHGKGKKLIITPVSTSAMVEELVESLGADLTYTAVGSPVVARRMIADGSPMGGEDNGGLIFADHQYCRDGAMTAARMIEAVAKYGSLQAQADQLPKYVTIKAAARCDNDKKSVLVDRIAVNHSSEKIDRTDGLKIIFDDGWVLLRPSGTEPKFRIYSESKDADVAKRRSEQFVAEVADILGSLRDVP
jgi:phosphomannomutase/phosphoglucomutase